MSKTRRVVAWPAFKNAGKNPYNSLLYRSVVRGGYAVDEFSPGALLKSFSALHVHWPESFAAVKGGPESFLRLAALLATCALARLKGAKVVWTVHNVSAHESAHKWLEQIYVAAFSALVTDLIHLTNSSENEFRHLNGRKLIAAKRSHVIPHGPYEIIHRPAAGRGSPTQTLLSVGQLRSYKKLDDLVETWAECDVQGWTLAIAGYGNDAAYVANLVQKVDRTDAVSIQVRWLTNAEVDNLLLTSSAVIVTGERLNSGAVYLALSAMRRVIAPTSPAIDELAALVGDGWIVPYDGELTRSALEQSIRALACKPPAGPPKMAPWDLIATATISVYEGESN